MATYHASVAPYHSCRVPSQAFTTASHASIVTTDNVSGSLVIPIAYMEAGWALKALSQAYILNYQAYIVTFDIFLTASPNHIVTF